MRLLHLKLSNCNSSTANTTAAFLAHYNILHICPQLEWQKQPALELTSREKVWPVGYKSRSCPAGNAAPIFNHKPSVFQLGRMGRPQLAHRKVAEANIEISNKMSPRPHTHADTLEQKGKKKTQLSMSRKSSGWWEEKWFMFSAPAVHVLKTPLKTFKTSPNTRVHSRPSQLNRPT